METRRSHPLPLLPLLSQQQRLCLRQGPVSAPLGQGGLRGRGRRSLGTRRGHPLLLLFQQQHLWTLQSPASTPLPRGGREARGHRSLETRRRNPFPLLPLPSQQQRLCPQQCLVSALMGPGSLQERGHRCSETRRNHPLPLLQLSPRQQRLWALASRASTRLPWGGRQARPPPCLETRRRNPLPLLRLLPQQQLRACSAMTRVRPHHLPLSLALPWLTAARRSLLLSPQYSRRLRWRAVVGHHLRCPQPWLAARKAPPGRCSRTMKTTAGPPPPLRLQWLLLAHHHCQCQSQSMYGRFRHPPAVGKHRCQLQMNRTRRCKVSS